MSGLTESQKTEKRHHEAFCSAGLTVVARVKKAYFEKKTSCVLLKAFLKVL